MSEPFAESPPSNSSLQAADDLRAAASGKTREIVQTAEEKAKLLKDSAAEKAKELREVASKKTVQIRESAEENVQQIRGVTGEQLQETRLKLREFHTDAESLIRQHPTQTVVAAAAIGFIAGLIIRR